MKLYTVLLLSLGLIPSLSAEDKLFKAINGNDLNFYFLVPGFFVTSEEKKRYFTMAQKMTNRAFEELNSISFNDIGNFVKGTAKMGAAVIGAAGLYAYYKGYVDVSLWSGYHTDKPAVRDCKSNELDGHYRTGLYSGLGVIAAYLFCSGARDFANIIGKEHRLKRYRDALAVEAFIQRLPVDPDECGKIVKACGT